MILCRTTLWLTLSALPLACAARGEAPRNAQNAATVTATQPEHIPVRRIRWFESGLAQIEREGLPTGRIVKFHVPRPHLDDILRTLVIHGPDGRVPQFSVDFDSVVVPAVAQAEANLPAERGAGHAYMDLLLSLKGERVEVSTRGRAEQGRLVDVVPWSPEQADEKQEATEKKPTKGKSSASSTDTKGNLTATSGYELTMLTDAGAIVRVRARDSLRVRPLDERRAARLAKALLSRSASAEQYSPELRVRTDRNDAVTVSYVSEAPVPRLNYRLDLSGSSAKLTGSVLVHNDSDESWKDVSVQICNDEPDTAVFPLAAPRYNIRQVQTPSSDMGSLLPQLRGSSADSLTAGKDQTLLLGNASATSSSRGSTQPVKWTPKPAGRRGSLKTSYLYGVSSPLSLGAHESALVPFLEATLKAEQGVWLRSGEQVGRSIVRLENTTSRPVPAGLLTVFESGRYAGATQLTPIEPQQMGFLDYGIESEVSAKWNQDPAPPSESTISSVVWDENELRISTRALGGQTIQLTNASNRDVAVYVTVTISEGGKITGGDRIETLGATRPMAAVITVPAHKQVSRTLVTDQTNLSTFDFDSPDLDEFKKLTESTVLPAATRTTLKAAYGELLSMRDTQTAMERNEEEIGRIDAAVERLPSSNQTQGIAARLVQLESQRLGLQQKNAQLERAKAAKLVAIKLRLSQLKPAAR